MSSPVVSSRTPVGQIISPDGTATFAFLKWMQNIGTTVNVAFDSEGAYQGEIGDQATIDGRETLESIVQNISTDGVVQGPGIDFALPYLNKDTDHIADGSGSPLAGGKEAYEVLVASGPASGETIRFDGTDWLPVAIAVSKPATAHQWIASYDAATGAFTEAQPAFPDVSGVATKAQLPASIAYEDEANTFTANQAITGNLSVSGTLTAGGKTVQPQLTLTTTGSSGPATLVGATLNIPQYSGGSGMVYPAAGLGVSTGTAWGTSIDPATVPRTSVANTFTAAQTINGALTTTGTITAANAHLRIGDRALGTWTTGSPNINCDVNSLVLNAAAPGNIIFNYDQGSNVYFGGGAGNLVGHVDNAGNASFNGTITAGGSKTFRVPHPLDETKDLIHACLEGPENGVYYRGRAKTDDLGYVTVLLPDYFEALTYTEDRSVLLTVINDGSDSFPLLKSSEVSAGGFSVRSSIPGTEFYWEVKAIRRVGVERLQVAQDKA